MKKAALVVVIAITFFFLFPLSWRIGERFFTVSFNRSLYDPVLLVCPDHVEIHLLHELAERPIPSAMGDGCTFHVASERQEWIRKVVPQLKSPGDSSWTVRVKQLGGNQQQIDLELLGDGVAGMIYEVRDNRITPINSRQAGIGSLIYPLTINFLLWFVLWLVVWAINRLRASSVPIL